MIFALWMQILSLRLTHLFLTEKQKLCSRRICDPHLLGPQTINLPDQMDQIKLKQVEIAILKHQLRHMFEFAFFDRFV